MSPRTLFQAAIAELEAVLSPRVVSRSLKEGMAQVGSSPDALELSDLERILKAQIYRQLQVAMPIEKAKETISVILERLRTVDNGGAPRDPTPPPLEAQRAAVGELKEAMRPFNLYFEWSEVQKLRAQIQLLDSETDGGKEASGLLRETREQLRTVSQKLEDHLVIQARDLGELEGLLEQVQSLGGPKVRRLDNLLGQIREAQSQRQLATAEIERARKLGTELRKLLESSVLAETEQAPPADGGILEVDQEEDEQLAVVRDVDEGVNSRLLMIDLESERVELAAVETANSYLLQHKPELRERIDRLRARLAGGDPVGNELSPLREELERSTSELRRSLGEELEDIQADSVRLRQYVDTSEFDRALQVVRGVLDSSLPEFADVQRVRDLHALAADEARETEMREEAAEAERQAALSEQAALLARLDETVKRHRNEGVAADELEELQGGLAALRVAHQQEEHVPELLAAVRRAEERFQAALASDSENSSVLPQARALIAELESLPLLPPLRERARALHEKLEEFVESAAGAGRDDGGDDELAECRALLSTLRQDLSLAYAERLREARREATELGQQKQIAEAIEAAELELAQNGFPRLHAIDSSLRSAFDRRRQEEMAELRTLELEAGRFAGIGLPGHEQLQRLLEQAKEAAPGSASALLLSRAWLQLEALRATVEQRLAGVDSRLDAALLLLARVEALNSEDVQEARRILEHLDDQRESLGRVSLGLRLELESSLQHAEALLGKLEQEYEATRAIADQLVSGNFIDDMLGLLGGDAAKPVSESQQVDIPHPSTSSEPREARSDDARINAWVDGYLREEGVVSMALLDPAGQLVAGRLWSSPEEARPALDKLMGELQGLGEELARGRPQLATLELGNITIIASRPLGNYRMLAVLETPSALSRVLHRLRREFSSAAGKATGGPPVA